MPPKREEEAEEEKESGGRKGKEVIVDPGNESEVVYIPKFLSSSKLSWDYFDFLNKQIPWTRPTIRVFGRSLPQVLFSQHSLFSLFYDLVSCTNMVFHFLQL